MTAALLCVPLLLPQLGQCRLCLHELALEPVGQAGAGTDMAAGQQVTRPLLHK